MRQTGWNLVRALAEGIRVARFMCIQFLRFFLLTRWLFGNYLLFLMHILARPSLPEGEPCENNLASFRKKDSGEKPAKNPFSHWPRGRRAETSSGRPTQERGGTNRFLSGKQVRKARSRTRKGTRNVPVGGPSPVPGGKTLPEHSGGKTLPEHSRKNRPPRPKFGFCPFSHRFSTLFSASRTRAAYKQAPYFQPPTPNCVRNTFLWRA